MSVINTGAALSARLAEALYSEALVLADEMRSYFNVGSGRTERDALDPHGRVLFACESLKATTRLMHVIAWLATRRADATGEASVQGASPSDRKLAEAQRTEPTVLARMPTDARRLILNGIDLYERVGRLAEGVDAPSIGPSPARALIERLERAF